MVCIDELALLKDIEKLTKQTIPQEIIKGFEVDPSIGAQPIKATRQARPQSKSKHPPKPQATQAKGRPKRVTSR